MDNGRSTRTTKQILFPLPSNMPRPFSLLLLLTILEIAQSAWTLDIAPYEEACFVIRNSGNSNRLLTGNYEMLNAELSAEPLLVYIMEVERVVWHSKANTPSDSFHAQLKPNLKYWLCLQNSSHGPLAKGNEPDHMDELERKVGFNYRIQKDPTQAPKLGEDWNDEKTEEWMEVAREVSEDLHDYYDHFDYVKKREADHRSLVEKTFSDILLWTLVEASIVVMSALGQVFFYRRYLEKQQHSYY